MFNYFTCGEIDKFTFYRMPKVLITDDRFKKYPAKQSCCTGYSLTEQTYQRLTVGLMKKIGCMCILKTKKQWRCLM